MNTKYKQSTFLLLLMFSLLTLYSQENDSKPLTHIVICWFNDDTGSTDVDSVINEIQKLASIPGIISLDVGKSIESEREIVDDSFTIAITMKFASTMDMNGYLTNKDHVKFVDEVLKPKLNKIVVYDFEN